MKLDGRKTLTYEIFHNNSKLVGTVYGKFKNANDAIATWRQRMGVGYNDAYAVTELTVRPQLVTALDNWGN